VPAPSGIRAVGDGAVRSLFDRTRFKEAGVPGCEAVGEPTDVVGVMGFIRRPLMMAGAGTAGCIGVSDLGAGFGDRGGGGGRTFSRCAARYALLLIAGVGGSPGVGVGLYRVGELSREGG
jgi:hypothetical protein